MERPFSVEQTIAFWSGDLLRRAEDPTLPILPKDRRTIKEVIGRMEQDIADPAELCRGFRSLDILVPRHNLKTKTPMIGRHMLTPAHLDRMRSRLTAQEHDMEDHPLMQLPASVRNTIFEGGMLINGTDRCTNACSFCGVSEKGPITHKLSRKGVNTLISSYSQSKSRQPDSGPNKGKIVDILYWGNDPLELMWQKGENEEEDYEDIVKEYDRIMQGKNCYLFTSTALPLGTELKALRTMLTVMELQNPHDVGRVIFRISQTTQNWEAAASLQQITESLVPESKNTCIVSSMRNNDPFITGTGWQRVPPTKIRYEDIININCTDGVCISPTDMEAKIMVGASIDRPNGEENYPIARTQGDGSTLYYVPKQNGIKRHIDAQYYVYDSRGSFIRTETDAQNPHRALFRIALIITNFLNAEVSIAAPLYRGVPAGIREYIRQSDIDLLRMHLSLGNPNPSMEQILNTLHKSGVINNAGMLTY